MELIGSYCRPEPGAGADAALYGVEGLATGYRMPSARTSSTQQTDDLTSWRADDPAGSHMAAAARAQHNSSASTLDSARLFQGMQAVQDATRADQYFGGARQEGGGAMVGAEGPQIAVTGVRDPRAAGRMAANGRYESVSPHGSSLSDDGSGITSSGDRTTQMDDAGAAVAMAAHSGSRPQDVLEAPSAETTGSVGKILFESSNRVR
jgi:hypothetical protein